jgi:hypothetical protein
MNNPEVQWVAPAPLWESAASSGAVTPESSLRPALLRFASDNFMNEFASVLQTNPEQLKDFRARRETWRGPETTPTVESVDHLPKLVRKLHRSRLIAQKATARRLSVVNRPVGTPRPLKLYQPAHQRYYLISAGLVCQIAGQPDRHIDPGNQERVTFVVRKVVPWEGVSIMESTEETRSEYAFVNNGWLKLGPGSVRALFPLEEQNPLFPVTYTHHDGHRRRVLAGLVPVGKREAYIAAPQRTQDQKIVMPAGQTAPPDPRTLLFMAQVTEPWKRLVERAAALNRMQTTQPSPLTNDSALTGLALEKSLKESREQMQTASWYVLLDFAKLLCQYIPNVWEAITGRPLSSPLNTAQTSLINALLNAQMSDVYEAALRGPRYPDQNNVRRSVVPSRSIRSLHAALKEFRDALPFDQSGQAVHGSLEHTLETIVAPYDRNPSSGATPWPGFLFPLADPQHGGLLPPATRGGRANPDPLLAALERIDDLAELIEKALPPQALERTPPPLLAAQPVMDVDVPAYFVIRCVFERPNCGPLQPSVVSESTEPFAMAGFFDPDAPARPVRIGLPVDTTPAGLRKFDKNTAFMISDVLCSQIDRAKGLGLGDLVRSVLPWPLHKDLDVPDTGPCKEDGLSMGMICSLSIPIITICALILLMIMVSLLDIIFRWIPFFIMCLPLPKFSGKQASA